MTTDPAPAKPGRQGIPGARTPFPLVEHVPAQLAEDPMIVAFLDALDEVWAPVITTLDCFDSYLDPLLAPPDMVAYLGSWILALTNDARDAEGLRADVGAAHLVSSWSGTAQVLQDRLVPREAERVTVVDPGGVLTSTTPTDPLTWADPADPTVTVSLTTSTVPGRQGTERLVRLIHDLVPAHVPVDVRIG